ncbi:MAG: (d)CMP kinase [Thermomicrobiales bacterium]
MIAIDGPAAAGKTTVARAVADRLRATLFDTGVLYRTVTLAAIRRGIPDTAHNALAELAATVPIAIRPPGVADGRLYDVILDGEDVTWAIREKQVEARVSAVSAIPSVRNALMPAQRRIAAAGFVVMVGRDVGSVVIPEAGLKVFLDASVEERARRRARELEERGTPGDSDAILAAMRVRDAYDSERAVAPLRVADDAVVIATDHRSVSSIVDEIVSVAMACGITAPAEARRR